LKDALEFLLRITPIRFVGLSLRSEIRQRHRSSILLYEATVSGGSEDVVVCVEIVASVECYSATRVGISSQFYHGVANIMTLIGTITTSAATASGKSR